MDGIQVTALPFTTHSSRCWPAAEKALRLGACLCSCAGLAVVALLWNSWHCSSENSACSPGGSSRQ